MKQIYKIHFWHGLDGRSQLFKKIDLMCELVQEGEEDHYAFEGSLDEFSRWYEGDFIYMQRSGSHLPLICVTQHKTFSAR